MRIFQMLCRKKGLPNGHIFRGKYRLVRQVTRADEQKLKNEFEMQEQNMFYLRHPYLTLEQSYGHGRALGKPEQRLLELKMKCKEFKPHVKLEDRLGHLRFREPWD